MKRVLPALKYAAAGVLATLAGMSAGHLVAAALNPASSPVLAVGSTVIDLTPTPMKEWAVREFGTKDKPILIGSVMLVTLLLTAVAGVIARRRFALGAAILALLVAVSGVLALLRPFALATDVVPAIAAAIVGVAVLALLVHVMRRSDGLPGLALPAARSARRRSGATAPVEDLGGGKTATETHPTTARTASSCPAPAGARAT